MAREMIRSALSFLYCFIAIFIAAYVPFPEGALQGQWVGEYAPAQNVLAVIVGYFFLLGLFEFRVPRELPEFVD